LWATLGRTANDFNLMFLLSLRVMSVASFFGMVYMENSSLANKNFYIVSCLLLNQGGAVRTYRAKGDTVFFECCSVRPLVCPWLLGFCHFGLCLNTKLYGLCVVFEKYFPCSHQWSAPTPR